MSIDNNAVQGQGIATAAIGAFLFVQSDLATDDYIKVGTANCRAIGVSPGYSNAAGVALKYARAGEAQVIAGGTVTRGDRVVCDSAGKAVTAAAGGSVNQNICGIARRSAASGDIFPIQIEIYQDTAGDYLS